MTEEQLDFAARALCEARNKDPEAVRFACRDKVVTQLDAARREVKRAHQVQLAIAYAQFAHPTPVPIVRIPS